MCLLVATEFYYICTSSSGNGVGVQRGVSGRQHRVLRQPGWELKTSLSCPSAPLFEMLLLVTPHQNLLPSVLVKRP